MIETAAKSKLKRRTTDHNQRTEKTERNRRICELRREGWQFEAIGEEFDITMQAASKIYHRDKEKYDDGTDTS